MQYLIYGLAIYILLFGVRFFLLFQQLIGLTYHFPKTEIKSESEVPEYIKDLFRIVWQNLESLDFKFLSYVETDPIVQDYGKQWIGLLYNETFKTYAIASIRSQPDPANLFDINFYTFFENGICLLTVNGDAHNFFIDIPQTIIQDFYTSTTETQWQLHKDKLDELWKIKIPKKMSHEAVFETIQSNDIAYLENMVASKKALQQPDTGLFQLKVATAISATFKIMRGLKKLVKLNKERAAQAKKTNSFIAEIPVEIEVEAYHRFERFQRRRAQINLKIWLLMGSLLLFVVALIPLFKLQDIIILISVLCLHEFGHFIAMKLSGYQDTSIFFLPLFGAATSGRKDNATLTEKVMVLLAGPLPGLLLGAGIAIALQGNFYRRSWGYSLVSWLVTLNYLNLLPILPLDGGKIIDRLLFSRHPYTDVLFKLFTIGMLVFVTANLHDPISLPLGIAIALTMPSSFRSAQILKKLQRKQQQFSDDPDSWLPSIFHTIQQAGFGTMPFAQKYRMAKDILQRCGEFKASWITRLSLIALYFACLLGGLILVAIAFLPPAYLWAIFNYYFQ